MDETFERPGPACPACTGATCARPEPARPEAGNLFFSVPTVHCAGCISAIERTLEAMPGIRSARVNLTLKRVTVDADPERVTAEDIVAALGKIGYEAHPLDPSLVADPNRDAGSRDLLMRMAVAGFAAMNVMLLSISVWAGASDTTRDFLHWMSAVIALPATAFAAQPFFRNAWQALKVRRLNMDVPISLAIVLALALSLYETANSGEDAYFDAALSLTFFLLAGRWLDHRTRIAARSAARELAALEAPKAIRLTERGEETVPVGELAPGERIRILPGMRVPADGVIEEGSTEVDRAYLTGETVPVALGPGDAIHAGEGNLTGALTARVTAAGQDSTLSRIAALVSLAETARNRYTSLADRAAAIYAPAVHLLALAAFIGWYLLRGDAHFAITTAIAVLIITCPCALGLAVPAVTTVASGRLFRRGVLLKSATALERLAEVDTVLFDKTGTLTRGMPELEWPERVPPRAFAIAAGLARGTLHPLGQAIARAAKARGVAPAEIADVREIPGKGLEGVFEGRRVRLGRADWVGAEGGEGMESWLAVEGEEPVRFSFTDAPLKAARELIDALRARGLDIRLVTGDREREAANLARILGIPSDKVHAGATPEDKFALVEALGGQGRKVLMVGDGLNDTAALAAAHVSVAPGTALEAARNAADVVLTGRRIELLPGLLDTARSARRRILENFALAALYNAIAIPVALAGLASPLAAAIAMSMSSITVSLNALRVK